MNSSGIVPLTSNVQEIYELLVGFDGKVKEITNWLTFDLQCLSCLFSKA